MTLQLVRGGAALNPLLLAGAGSGYSTMALDASGEQAAFIFQIPESGTVDAIRIRVVGATTPELLRVGLYTVDASGNPTASAYGGMVAGTGTPAANSDLRVALATSATVVAGEFAAVVVEFDSAVGAVSIGRAFNPQSNIPYSALFTASWAKSHEPPVFALEYAGGIYHNAFGVLPFTGGMSAESFHLNTGIFDEYGFLWTPPFPGRLRGVLAFLGPGGNAYELVRYDGTTPVETLAFDGDYAGNGGLRVTTLLLPTPAVFAAGDPVRVAIRPTTGSGIFLAHGTVGDAAVLGAWFGAGFTLCRRLDQGAWTDETTMVPFMFPLFDQLDDGAGGGSSGLLTHAGMSGGLNA